MTRLELALKQIDQTRQYSLWLLDSIDPADWFRPCPAGGTHVAWQAGHLAYAQYRLALARIRGSRPEDAELIPAEFRQRFAGMTVPDPDPTRDPQPAAIRAVLLRVHQQVLRELPGLADTELDAVAPPPEHPRFRTKLGALLWCAQHEMVHAGQIGLLRRWLGLAPLW